MAPGGRNDVEIFLSDNLHQLSRLAMLLTLEVHEAEDLVQQAALRVQQKWPLVAGADNPAAYVRRLMLNEFLGDRRRRKREKHAHRGLAVAATSQDDVAGQVERRQVVTAMLLQLPARQRAAIALRYLEDRPDPEIASILGCREATVRSLIRRGLDTLRRDTPRNPKEKASVRHE